MPFGGEQWWNVRNILNIENLGGLNHGQATQSQDG